MNKGRFKNKSKLKFMTEEKNKRRRVGYFFLGFGIFALLLGAVSFVMLFREYNYDLSNMIKQPEKETTQPETETEPIKLSGKPKFLLIGTSNDEKEIRFISVVEADLDEQQLKVCMLPSDAQLFDDSGKAEVLGNCFEKDGAKGVADALTDYGINITRYICVRDQSVKKIINTFGGVVITTEKEIKHKDDAIELNLAKGKQTLKGDTSVRYLKYGWESNAEKLEKQAEFICCMFDQFIIEKNTKKGESLFNEIVNLVDTNITAIDFGKTQAQIKAFSESGSRKPSETIEGIDKLKD